MDAAILTRYDLSRDENVTTLRTQFLRPALAAGDRASADRILAYIVQKRPDRIDEQIELVDLALDAGNGARARVLFGALNVDFSDPNGNTQPSHCTGALRIALRLDQVPYAAKIARRFVPQFDDDPMLAFLAMRAFDRSNDDAAFLKAAEKVAELCIDDPEKLAELLHRLCTHGHGRHGLDLMRSLDPLRIPNFAFLLQYGRAMLLARATDPKTVEVLEAAFALDPTHGQAQSLLSKAYLRADKPAKALAVLGDDLTTLATASQSMRAQTAAALLSNKRFADAVSFYAQLVTEDPHHAGWKRAYVSALLALGDEKTAQDIYSSDLRARGLDRFPGFDAALQSLDAKVDSVNIPAERFEWAYRRLEHMGCAPADRQTWERRCKWVHLADHLTLDWIEARSGDLDQIRARIIGADEPLETLRHHAEKGLGVFAVSAHVGALFAGPLVLDNSDLDYRWVASTPVISTAPGAARLISTQSQNRLRLAKKIIGAVREGAVVSVAVDGVSAQAIPFLDDQIFVSDFTPRTIFQTGAKSFFPQVVWDEDQIVVRVIQMPDPEPTDTLDHFLSVWFAAYAQAVADTFRDYPDNMRLTGGFWSEVQL